MTGIRSLVAFIYIYIYKPCQRASRRTGMNQFSKHRTSMLNEPPALPLARKWRAREEINGGGNVSTCDVTALAICTKGMRHAGQCKKATAPKEFAHSSQHKTNKRTKP